MPHSDPMSKNFPLTAAMFEGGLIVVAVVLGWLLDSSPLRSFRLDWPDAAIGAAATAPLLALLWACLACRWTPLRNIVAILDEMLVPLLRESSIAQLAVIAVLAGIGEEMLFRGVVQPAVAQTLGGEYADLLGLAMSAILFGLFHPITPTYAALAALIGLYLGWLLLVYGNLLVPIVAHALYDFLALAYLVKIRGKKRD